MDRLGGSTSLGMYTAGSFHGALSDAADIIVEEALRLNYLGLIDAVVKGSTLRRNKTISVKDLDREQKSGRFFNVVRET